MRTALGRARDMSVDGDSEAVSAKLREQLDELDCEDLRAVRDYTDDRLRSMQMSIAEEVIAQSANPSTIIVQRERPGRVLLKKQYQCSDEETKDFPQSDLYCITRERRPSGGSRLHWRLLGPVYE